MPESKLIVPSTYAALRQAVVNVVLKGRREIDRAWLLTYHETGRLIHEHLLLNKDRANYGAQVFAKLAADTDTSSRSLHEFVQFYRFFPIVRGRAQLGWSHYRLLCQVADPGRRRALLAEAVKRHWPSPQLEREVRALAQANAEASDAARDVTPPKLLTPKRGTPGLCRVVANGHGLSADLGFATFLDLTARESRGMADGGFLRWEDDRSVAAAPKATKADLFTYRAEILKVVDGDTLWVRVGLGRGVAAKHKLRLRDLDCPEMSTPEGKAAKRYVDGLVARTKALTICTTKPDKYDRYLADVFLTLAPSSSSGQAAEEVYLNNALLENGHAVPKKAWEFGDWGEA